MLLLLRMAGLPARPTYHHLVCFGGCCPHTHGRQAARAYDFAALHLAGLCEMVPYKHGAALAGDCTFLLESGWRLPVVACRPRWRSC